MKRAFKRDGTGAENMKTNSNTPLADGEIRQRIGLMLPEEKNALAKLTLEFLKSGKAFPDTNDGRTMAELERQAAPELTSEQIRALKALPGWDEFMDAPDGIEGGPSTFPQERQR